jgi:hypothetical protein
MLLLNKHHCWTFSNKVITNVNLELNLLIYYVSHVLKLFCYYYNDNSV